MPTKKEAILWNEQPPDKVTSVAVALVSSSPTPAGAGLDASYVTMAAEGGLQKERVLTAGTGITLTDGGENSTVTIAVDTATIAANLFIGRLEGPHIGLFENETADPDENEIFLEFTDTANVSYFSVGSLDYATNSQWMRIGYADKANIYLADQSVTDPDPEEHTDIVVETGCLESSGALSGDILTADGSDGVSWADAIALRDSKAVTLGTDSDLAISHDGTNGIVDINTGELRVSSDAGATNYLAIEADGTLEFNGNATVWDDLRVTLEAVKVTGANQPAWEKVKDDGAGSAGVYAWNFDDGDECWFSVQLPHSWKLESTIYPHLHWCAEGDASAANVGIGLEYTWCDTGETFGNTTLLPRDVAGDTAFKSILSNFSDSGIAGTGHTLSSVLLCRFYRYAAASDNYAGGIFALELDFHYEMDTVGSRQVAAK